MEFSNFFIRIYVLHILSSFLGSFGHGQIIDFRMLQNLTEINQFTPILEAIKLVDRFVHSYRTNPSTNGTLRSYQVIEEDKFLTSGSESDVKGGKCSDDIKHILNNIETEWALEMLDATGKFASGILRGSVLIPGQYRECITAYSPLDEEGHGGFHGRYCVSSWSLSGKLSYRPLQIGICVPDSCSGENIETLLRNVLHDIDDYQGLKTLKSHLTLNGVACKNRDRPLDSPSIIYLCIVSIFIAFTVIGSLLTILRYFKTKYASRRKSLNGANAELYGKLKAQNDEIPCCGTFEAKSSSDKPYSTQQPDYNLKRILLCFSAIDNSRKIFDVEKTEGQLLIIHGIKVLCMAWVILGHTYVFSTEVGGNVYDPIKSMDKLIFEVVFQATLAVDAFFLISGFLLTYIFLRVPKRKINWTLFYVHRLWRLTPSYLASTFFVMLVFKYIGSGPFWIDNHCDEKRSGWWMYIFYLNNFIPRDKICAVWTWYIANDIQFYAVSPLFLYPLWKWPKMGLIILGSVLLASLSITGMITYIYDVYPIFTETTITEDYDKLIKRNPHSYDLVYTKPYCRIGPYIIGIILGYILYKTADKKEFLNWWQQVSGWFLALCCLLIPVFGLYHVEVTKTVCLIHNVFARTIFSVGLAWLIYACATGHGGFLTDMLSWKVFIPLSRLTYSVYLVNIIVINFYYFSYVAPLEYTHMIAIVNFLGFFVMSYGLALVFSLVFESPFLNLEKLLLREKQLQKEKEK